MTKQQITKRQHHIPQMLLKNFVDESAKLYMRDIEKSTTKYQTVETVAFQKHLYTVHYEKGKDDQLEKDFSAFESEAAPTLDRVLNRKIVYSSQEDIQRILRFTALLMARTPKFVNLAEVKGTSSEMVKILYDKGTQKNLPKEKIDEYVRNMLTAKGFSYAKTFNSTWEDLFTQLVSYFNPVLCFADAGTFSVSDNYVTFEPLRGFDANDAITPWWKRSVHIHCPLSSNTCLTYVPKEDLKKVGTLDISWRKRMVDKAFVTVVNKFTKIQAERYLYCLDKTAIE